MKILRKFPFLGIGLLVDLTLGIFHYLELIHPDFSIYGGVVLLGAVLDRLMHVEGMTEKLTFGLTSLSSDLKSSTDRFDRLRDEVLHWHDSVQSQVARTAEASQAETKRSIEAIEGLSAQIVTWSREGSAANLRASETLARLAETVKAGDEVRKSIDDVKERYKDLGAHLDRLLFKIKEMAERGAVAVERRSDIYTEDIRLIANLTDGQELGACAFVQDDPRQQFLDDQDFLGFLKAQIRASRRGVRVKRVYVCETKEDARNADFLIHLKSLQDEIHQRGNPEHFEVGVLVLENLRSAIRKEFWIDVLIFGNDRVSYGDLSDRTQTLLRAEYRSDEKFVREAKLRFMKVFNAAKPLAKFFAEEQQGS